MQFVPAKTSEEYASLASANPDGMLRDRASVKEYLEINHNELSAESIEEIMESLTFKGGRLSCGYFGHLEDKLGKENMVVFFERCGIDKELFGLIKYQKCKKSWAGWGCENATERDFCDPITCTGT